MTTEGTIRLGLVGVGEIARKQHLPAIAADPAFTLVATASRNAAVDDVPAHRKLAEMLAAGHRLDAVALCTPPHGRYAQARKAIAAGLHVLLEKPPGATVSEVLDLQARAAAAGTTLFASWHSRERAAVDAARTWLVDKRVRSIAIDWREDIRVWHPGQEWILAAGGYGVFDPGINALSIATAILPDALRVAACRMAVPQGRSAPIAASLELIYGDDAPGAVELDFLQTGTQTWDLTVVTDAGTLRLSEGGAQLSIDGRETVGGDVDDEYPRLYRRFARLIRAGASEVDVRPQQLVADAFVLAEVSTVEPFAF